MGSLEPMLTPTSTGMAGHQTITPMARTQIWRLWGHFGCHEHNTGLMLAWRNQAWWRSEQNSRHGLRHPSRFNALLKTEKMIEQIAPPWRATVRGRP